MSYGAGCNVCGGLSRHDEDCVECLRCDGRGWIPAHVVLHAKFMPMKMGNFFPQNSFWQTCPGCRGGGRIGVPGTLLAARF